MRIQKLGSRCAPALRQSWESENLLKKFMLSRCWGKNVFHAVDDVIPTILSTAAIEQRHFRRYYYCLKTMGLGFNYLLKKKHCGISLTWFSCRTFDEDIAFLMQILFSSKVNFVFHFKVFFFFHYSNEYFTLSSSCTR